MAHGEPSGEARAARYRARAEELRAVGALLRDPKSKVLILSTADDYERMALAVERVIAGRQTTDRDERSGDG